MASLAALVALALTGCADDLRVDRDISYGDDPANHQWCCKPHAASEAEWSDELAARRARGELNPQAWPPVIDSDAFDVNASDEILPDPAATPGEQPPDELSMDDLE